MLAHSFPATVPLHDSHCPRLIIVQLPAAASRAPFGIAVAIS
jgi:hypothetical protein